MIKRLYVKKKVKISQKIVYASESSSWTSVHHYHALKHLSLLLTLSSSVHLRNFSHIFSVVIFFLLILLSVRGARFRRAKGAYLPMADWPYGQSEPGQEASGGSHVSGFETVWSVLHGR